MSTDFDELFKTGRYQGGFTKFIRTINTEEKARNLFQWLGLLDFKHAKCECGNRFLLKNKDNSMKSGFRWRCLANVHLSSKKFNPLKNTWFERSHLSFLQNLELLLHWFYRMSWRLTQADTRTPDHTIGDWRSFAREVCLISFSNHQKKIGGIGHWVEVDETHLFRRKYHRGHRIKGESIWLIGGYDRTSKQRFVMRVKDRKKKTLWPLLKKHIRRGSILVTDDFRSYHGIDKKLGFAAHEVVVHRRGFTNPLFPDVYTNNIESVWSKLKKLVKRSDSNDAIDNFIGEFLYRDYLNRKFGSKNFGPQLLQFLKDVAKVYPGPNKIGWNT